MSDIVNLIKVAALQAVEQSAPMGFTVGTVIATKPLRVDINQKFLLEKQHLLLTSQVIDKNIDCTFDVPTSKEKEHIHMIFGRYTFTIHNALKVGEGVLLLRLPGGQQYLIIDRVV